MKSILDELNTLFVIMFTQRKIIIENNVTISHRVVLITHTDFGESQSLKKKYYPAKIGNITIKKGTYIGSNVTILQNVTI